MIVPIAVPLIQRLCVTDREANELSDSVVTYTSIRIETFKNILYDHKLFNYYEFLDN